MENGEKKKDKPELSVTERIYVLAEATARDVQRKHIRSGETCGACSRLISKEDIAAGRYAYCESKASGRVYLCKKCVEESQTREADQ